MLSEKTYRLWQHSAPRVLAPRARNITTRSLTRVNNIIMIMCQGFFPLSLHSRQTQKQQWRVHVHVYISIHVHGKIEEISGFPTHECRRKISGRHDYLIEKKNMFLNRQSFEAISLRMRQASVQKVSLLIQDVKVLKNTSQTKRPFPLLTLLNRRGGTKARQTEDY